MRAAGPFKLQYLVLRSVSVIIITTHVHRTQATCLAWVVSLLFAPS